MIEFIKKNLKWVLIGLAAIWAFLFANSFAKAAKVEERQEGRTDRARARQKNKSKRVAARQNRRASQQKQRQQTKRERNCLRKAKRVSGCGFGQIFKKCDKQAYRKLAANCQE